MTTCTIDVDTVIVSAALTVHKPIEDAATVVLFLADGNPRIIADARAAAESHLADEPDGLRRRVVDILALAGDSAQPPHDPYRSPLRSPGQPTSGQRDRR